MKRQSLILLLLIPIISANAQQWSLGGKAGVTFSNFKTKTPWEEVSNTGYTVGLTAYNKFNDNFGFIIEAQYIRKGYNHQICDVYYDKLKATYLEVPMLLDYGFSVPAMENLKIHFALGFYTAYWLNGEYETKIDDEAFTEPYDLVKSGTSRFDFGPSGGARLEYLLKHSSISLDYRYEMGLIDLQKKVSDDTNNVNRAMVLGISYMLMIGY